MHVQGNDVVEVEAMQAGSCAFGQGHKQSMTVSDFLHRLQGGHKLYLSTQEADVDFDGHPQLLTAPLSKLPGLPLKPQITKGLVPQAVNLWMGSSEDGTSSGLHHDFHDNLYVLLSGRKRFRLYSPAMTPRMYTHGRVRRIHDNGRCDARLDVYDCVLFMTCMHASAAEWSEHYTVQHTFCTFTALPAGFHSRMCFQLQD